MTGFLVSPWGGGQEVKVNSHTNRAGNVMAQEKNAQKKGLF